MNKDIMNAVGQISDGLIEVAEEKGAARYFKEKRKRKIRLFSGIAAAALCLSAVLCIPLFSRLGGKNPSGHDPAARRAYSEAFCMEYAAKNAGATGSKYIEEKTKLQQKLEYRLESDRNVYADGEQPTFTIKYGLIDTLGEGNLRITVEAGDFSVVGEAETVTENFTYPEYAGADACETTFSLRTDKKEAYGTIRVIFSFEQEGESGSSDAAASWGYIIHDNEIFFSPTLSAFEEYELRLEKLLEDKVISEQEFAETWYGLTYIDAVSADVPRSTKEGRIEIRYFSKNIRYESGIISNENIAKLWEDVMADINSREKSEKLAVAELDYLLSNKIITKKEYQAELDWIHEVRHIYPGEFTSVSISSEEARRIIEKYRYTH